MPLQHDAFECRASARAVVRNKLKHTGVAEPPKLLGPGALIFVAKQLSPKLALTDSSSSEASIKDTVFQDRTDNTHTKVSPEITTQIISYISEFAAESKFIT